MEDGLDHPVQSTEQRAAGLIEWDIVWRDVRYAHENKSRSEPIVLDSSQRPPIGYIITMLCCANRLVL